MPIGAMIGTNARAHSELEPAMLHRHNELSHSAKRVPFTGLVFGVGISLLLWSLVAAVILLELG